MLFLFFLFFSNLINSATHSQSESESKLESQLRNKILSPETLQILQTKIIGKNPQNIELTIKATFLLLCHGIDSYFQYKTIVAGAIVKYLTSSEYSYEKLIFQYFRAILADFLDDKECELKDLIVDALKNQKYENITKIREQIQSSIYITSKLSNGRRVLSQVFEGVFEEFISYLRKEFRICFEFDQTETKIMLKMNKEKQTEFLTFLDNEYTEGILDLNFSSVEVSLKHEIIGLKKFDELMSYLTKYKFKKLILNVDPELLLAVKIYTIETIKYIEHMNNLIRINGITEVGMKYYDLEFEFDQNNLVRNSDDIESAMHRNLLKFILSGYDFRHRLYILARNIEKSFSKDPKYTTKNLFLIRLNAMFRYLTEFITEKKKNEDEKALRDKNYIQKYPFSPISTSLQEKYTSNLPFDFQMSQRIGNVDFFIARNWSVKQSNPCSTLPFYFNYTNKIKNSTFLFLSTKYLLIASSENERDIQLLNYHSSVKEHFDQFLHTHILRLTENDLNINLNSKVIHGQIFDSIYFEELNNEKNTRNSQIQISIRCKRKDSLKMTNLTVFLKSIVGFKDLIEFHNCLLLPYDKYVKIFEILKETGQDIFRLSEIKLYDCEFEHSISFDHQNIHVYLIRCKITHDVYLGSHQFIEIIIRRFYNPKTIYNIQGMCFQESQLLNLPIRKVNLL